VLCCAPGTGLAASASYYIHNEKPRLNWKLVVVEDLWMGNDGFVRAVNVRALGTM